MLIEKIKIDDDTLVRIQVLINKESDSPAKRVLLGASNEDLRRFLEDSYEHGQLMPTPAMQRAFESSIKPGNLTRRGFLGALVVGTASSMAGAILTLSKDQPVFAEPNDKKTLIAIVERMVAEPADAELRQQAQDLLDTMYRANQAKVEALGGMEQAKQVLHDNEVRESIRCTLGLGGAMVGAVGIVGRLMANDAYNKNKGIAVSKLLGLLNHQIVSVLPEQDRPIAKPVNLR